MKEKIVEDWLIIVVTAGLLLATWLLVRLVEAL